MEQPSFDEFFHGVPNNIEIDIERIRGDWMALGPPYTVEDWMLPLPVWAKRSYTETGAQAWQVLQGDLCNIPASKPICVYVHIPFCKSKCGFCDSWSFRLGQHQDDHVHDYVSQLVREMQLWSTIGSLGRRPVTTVHLGGGTPTFLGPSEFRRLIENCSRSFAVCPQTEWALESTVSDLSTEMLLCLHDLGFRRLHIGTQTMEDPVRRAIGRRSTRAEVIAKTAEAVEKGWVISVDLICGLPGQTLAGFLDGIRDLSLVGVDGFSLYELLIFHRNRKWAEQSGLIPRTHLANYWMFQAGAGYLESLGYRKNLFNHFANERDANLYFTFPTREADLLAIGTIADGVFGDYHYRHPWYSDYRNGLTDAFPALAGGLRRNDLENQLYPITTAILAGHIARALVPTLEIKLNGSGLTLLQDWFNKRLVEEEGPGLRLTANGSWLAGNMVSQLVARSGW